MKKYQILGGGFVTADSAKDLVEFLNNSSMFGFEFDIEKFMEQTSKACAIQTGAEIRTDSKEVFIADLIANGFITELE